MTRADVFEAVRKAAPADPFGNPANIRRLDDTLDALGVPRGDTSGDAFDKALAVILRHEGGFVNHPRDPGGMTNLGVTKNTWEAWTGKPATEATMRALTPATVAPLYRKNYWEKAGCDKLHPGIALCVFDFAVNAGPARAVRYLQKVVGTAQDGVIGPATLEMANAWADRALVDLYQEAREGYYRSLGTFATFGRGWLRRVAETTATAKELAR